MLNSSAWSIEVTLIRAVTKAGVRSLLNHLNETRMVMVEVSAMSPILMITSTRRHGDISQLLLYSVPSYRWSAQRIESAIFGYILMLAVMSAVLLPFVFKVD